MNIETGHWRTRAFALLTALLILCIVANPLLATFVPVLDALGLEVLIYLVSAQLSVVVGTMVLPLARQLHQRWGKRLIRQLSHVAFSSCGGYLRQLVLHVKVGGTMPFKVPRNSRFKAISPT